MRIIICVKLVPLTVRLDPGTGRVERDMPVGINAVDENAVEAALLLRDSIGNAEVVVLSLATEDAAGALRPALAMGADRAVMLTGKEFAGSDLLGSSRALAAAIAAIGADLVVFGASSSDGNGAMLWAAVGEHLRFPVISRAIDAALVDGVLTVTRQLETGLDVVEADLPAVLALSGEVNNPRYPSFKGVIAAKKKAVEVLRPGAGVEICSNTVGAAGSGTTVLSITEAPRRERGIVVEDDGHAHERLRDFLRERNLL